MDGTKTSELTHPEIINKFRNAGMTMKLQIQRSTRMNRPGSFKRASEDHDSQPAPAEQPADELRKVTVHRQHAHHNVTPDDLSGTFGFTLIGPNRLTGDRITDGIFLTAVESTVSNLRVGDRLTAINNLACARMTLVRVCNKLSRRFHRDHRALGC